MYFLAGRVYRLFEKNVQNIYNFKKLLHILFTSESHYFDHKIYLKYYFTDGISSTKKFFWGN